MKFSIKIKDDSVKETFVELLEEKSVTNKTSGVKDFQDKLFEKLKDKIQIEIEIGIYDRLVDVYCDYVKDCLEELTDEIATKFEEYMDKQK